MTNLEKIVIFKSFMSCVNLKKNEHEPAGLNKGWINSSEDLLICKTFFMTTKSMDCFAGTR